MSQKAPKDNGDTVTVSAEDVSERRVSQIFAARRELRQTRSQLMQDTPRSMHNTLEVAGAYRGVAETYLVEVEPLFYRTEHGRELWESADFGCVAVEPSLEGREIEESMVRAIAPEPPQVYGVEGVRSLLELPSPLVAEYEVTYGESHGMGRSRVVSDTIAATEELSVGMVDDVVRAANRYLSRIGVEAEIEDSEAWEVEDAEF